jgi:hypothetical protein
MRRVEGGSNGKQFRDSVIDYIGFRNKLGATVRQSFGG